MTQPPSEHSQPVVGVRYREVTERDAGAIATLHADSWRRHYRGAYLESAELLNERTDRMARQVARAEPGPGSWIPRRITFHQPLQRSEWTGASH
jgi:hypothetical protein